MTITIHDNGIQKRNLLLFKFSKTVWTHDENNMIFGVIVGETDYDKYNSQANGDGNSDVVVYI